MHFAIYTDSTEVYNGYGRVTRSVIEALTQRGHEVSVNGNVGGRAVKRNRAIDIAISQPWCVAPQIAQSRVFITMWEASEFPEATLARMRKHPCVVVPSQHNVDALKKHRIKAKLLPFGVAPAFMFMPGDGPLTFLSVSEDHGVPERKRASVVVEAFRKAFPVEAGVRLIVKQSPNCALIPNFDRRVELIRERYTDEQMLDLYSKAHVGVQISGLEGWGLPAHEFIAHGRPVIATLWGGHANFLDAKCAFPLEYKLCRAPKRVYGGVGQYAHASEQSLIRAFRWCYENPDDVALRGAAAYRKSLHFTPETFGARLISLL